MNEALRIRREVRRVVMPVNLERFCQVQALKRLVIRVFSTAGILLVLYIAGHFIVKYW